MPGYREVKGYSDSPEKSSAVRKVAVGFPLTLFARLNAYARDRNIPFGAAVKALCEEALHYEDIT